MTTTTSERTYGTLKRIKKDKRYVWELQAEPHVITRVKRLFASGKNNFAGKITLHDSDEICRDLDWVLTRYPLQISEEDHAYLHRESEQFECRVQQFLRVLEGSVNPEDFELALPLRNYQKVAATLIAQSPGLLVADATGTGKTVSAIAPLCKSDMRPALVVTLTHLPSQWRDEIKKFAPGLNVHILKKGTPYQINKDGKPYPDVIITNYAKLAGWSQTLCGIVRTVVFDECQELRRPVSEKYKAAKAIADHAQRRVGLSATPFYNYGGEFFYVLDVLFPGRLGKFEEFYREWCKGYYDRPQIADTVAFGTYMREQGMMIRRTRKDVGRELPPVSKIFHTVDPDMKDFNNLTKDIADLAKFLLSKEGSNFDKMKAGGELDWKLRQATGISKAPFSADLIKMLVESGESVVVFAWHHAVYDILMDKLKEYNPLKYTGEESTTQKNAAKKAFINGDCKVLLLSLRAGAGLDGLQFASRCVVFVELDWSSGIMQQCLDRVDRDMGDKSGEIDPVVAYYVLSSEGSDPIMSQVLGLKRAQHDGVVDLQTKVIEETTQANIKDLARSYLASRGITVVESVTSDEIDMPPQG